MSLEHWLGRINSKRVSESYLVRWHDWVGVNGGRFKKYSLDELVGFQRSSPNSYELLDLAQAWVKDLPLRVGSKRRAYSTVRSFFLHNRAGLPSDPGFKVVSDIPVVQGSLDVLELRRIVEACNPLYRAVFLSMLQSGMGCGELLFWSRNGLDSVRRQLWEGKRSLRIDLPGRKKYRNIKPFYTFIGSDAIDALSSYMEHRPQKEGALFLTAYDTPLTYPTLLDYWFKRLDRLGIIKRRIQEKGARYGKNMHEVRDIFRTRWQKSGAEGLVAEFMLGHSVDPLGYNKAMEDPGYVMREYRKAERWLNIITDDPEKIPLTEVEERDQRLEEQYGKAIGLLQKQIAYLLEETRKQRHVP